MSNDRYQKGIDKIQELTQSPDDNPTGFMDIGAGFKDIAPDLEKYVVEFAFGDIYSRPGLDNKKKVLTTITALVAQGKPQIEMHIKTGLRDRKSTRLNSSHVAISYAVFCLKKKRTPVMKTKITLK